LTHPALRRGDALDTTGVARVRLWPVEVPLVAPLVAGHGIEHVRRSTLVEVTLRTGAVGWGECPALSRPTYTGEYATAAWRVLRDELVPAALAGRGDEIRGHPMARFALEAALVDARLREAGDSLVDVVAPGGPRRLARTVVIGRGPDLGALVDAVGAARRSGAAMVKLKISAGWDRGPLAAVRDAYPGLPLAAHANRG
jgi:O-succinylbenzoate synthase